MITVFLCGALSGAGISAAFSHDPVGIAVAMFGVLSSAPWLRLYWRMRARALREAQDIVRRA